MQTTGIIAIFLAVFSKFGAAFATIPDAVAGGILLFNFSVFFCLLSTLICSS